MNQEFFYGVNQSFISFFSITFKITNPVIPAINEASMIYNFALLMATVSVNAKSVTKIDMVKPMPPKIPTPKTEGHVNPSVSWANLDLTAIYENSVIPNGFPSTSPNTMPIAQVGTVFPLAKFTVIAVLAKAKTGRIINATG